MCVRDANELIEMEIERRKFNYCCYDCGKQNFNSIDELREHLHQKTAWTNSSLIQCVVVIMFDDEDSFWPCSLNNSSRAPTTKPFWRRCYVQSFDQVKSLHKVCFFSDDHKEILKSLDFTKIFFFIKDRASTASDPSQLQLFPTEFVHHPHYTDEFVVAQSILAEIYGVQEVGHHTMGHRITTHSERHLAQEKGYCACFIFILS